MSKTHTAIIDDVYEIAAKDGAKGLYRQWAAQYEADNAALGFRLTSLAAAFVARYSSTDAKVLDAGCGTGLVARDLAVLGFQNISGVDLSEPMLDLARSSGFYRDLSCQELGTPLSFETGRFDTTVCVGAFGPGHAPASSLYELARVTFSGGHVIFNVVEHSYIEQGFPAVMDQMVAQGSWQLIEESAPFQPYTNGEPELFTRMFVFQRT